MLLLRIGEIKQHSIFDEGKSLLGMYVQYESETGPSRVEYMHCMEKNNENMMDL